jgi:hypothetical protein
MNNGTTTERRLSWKPRTSSKEIVPDAPEGEWEASIPKGKIKVTSTQKQDPRLLIPFRLDKAADKANESYQGATVPLSIIFFDEEDPERIKAANMMKVRLRAACEALGVDYDEVYPETIETEEDFNAIKDAFEGKSATIWTVHTSRKTENGETIVDTDIRFSKPGRASARHEDEEDEPRKGKGGKTSKGRR